MGISNEFLIVRKGRFVLLLEIGEVGKPYGLSISHGA